MPRKHEVLIIILPTFTTQRIRQVFKEKASIHMCHILIQTLPSQLWVLHRMPTTRVTVQYTYSVSLTRVP